MPAEPARAGAAARPAAGARRWLTGRAALLPPLALTLAFALLALLRPAIIEDYVENLLVDYRFKARNMIVPPAVPDQVVVVAIDERSLATLGRWPWTRTRIADLVERIHAAGPRALAVDLFFAEPESPAADTRLAEAFAARREKTVTGLVFEVRDGGSFRGEVPDLLLDQAISRVEQPSLLLPLEASHVLLPAEPLASAVEFGHVNYLPDRNGKLRTEYLYLRYGGEYFPSLSLQAARLFLGHAPGQVAIEGVLGVDLGGRLVPTDSHGGLYIDYYGRAGSFPSVSAADVLGGAVPPEALRGKLVFLGTTAVATYDMIVTPFAANVPGVEKNATVAANVIAGDYLHDAPPILDALLVLLAGCAVLLLCRRLGAKEAFASLFLFTLLLLAANLAAFTEGLRLSLVYPLGTVLGVGAAVISARFLGEERKAREYRRMFSNYVSERVVSELIADPSKARLGGERREVTVLFSDIRGFTTFSEQHQPEEVVAVLNEYLGAMTEVVFRWEGTLDKFIGDAVMVFWGAPLPQPDQAERALRCALHMCGRLDALNEKWVAEGKAPLGIGIGINSGEVIVGNVGAEGKRMDYTVIGDHVNLASRVEALTKKYQARILITEHTLRGIRPVLERSGFGHVIVRALETVAVKGKEQSVGIYEFAVGAQGTKTTVDERLGAGVVRMQEK